MNAVKKWAVKILMYFPPLPNFVWDSYVEWRVGSTPLINPEVDLVSWSGSEPATTRTLPLADLPAKPEGVVRLVFISDTHERHRQVALPEADVLLHCGDILFSSTLARQSRGVAVLQDFNEWLLSVPCKEKVIIGGNHDVALQRLGPVETAKLLSAATAVLQDTAVTLPMAKLKVYGNGYSEGHSHNQAWQAEAPEVSDACEGADIVLTHHHTKSVQEAVFAKTRPKVWASGHDHRGHGVSYQNGTLFANAAVLDHKYRPVQAPVVVDLPRDICVDR